MPPTDLRSRLLAAAAAALGLTACAAHDEAPSTPAPAASSVEESPQAVGVAEAESPVVEEEIAEDDEAAAETARPDDSEARAEPSEARRPAAPAPRLPLARRPRGDVRAAPAGSPGSTSTEDALCGASCGAECGGEPGDEE